MCDTCGCGQPGEEVTIRKPGEEDNNSLNPNPNPDLKHTHIDEHGNEYEHSHEHQHEHEHTDVHSPYSQHPTPHSIKGRKIVVEQDIMRRNNLIAERNRGYFEAKKIFALNLVSSPGSGKTSLIERTIKDMGKDIKFFIIEGDQQTMNDARRIEAAGAPVVQINTGNGCHLDADMINKAVKKLEVKDNSTLIIENVGNLICPSLFDLGESQRVVIISVTEGDDKPIKYPTMFSTSHICIINKTDLLPYVDFSIEKAKKYALHVNHHLKIFELSAKTGEGLDNWYRWLKNTKPEVRS